MRRDVLDFEAYRIAIAKLAADGEVEERQVAHLALHVQLGADRPDMFRLKGRFWSDEFTFVPRRAGSWRRIHALNECHSVPHFGWRRLQDDGRKLEAVSHPSPSRVHYLPHSRLQSLLDTITIMTDDFEWDRAKAAANFKKHGVKFEHAVIAFEDPFALVELDESEDYGEDRFLLTGRVGDGILVVVYTEREERVRIISAREATDYERRNYYRAAHED